MDVLERTDSMADLSFPRDEGLHGLGPLIRVSPSISTIKPELARKNNTRFVEDFYLEHSLTRVTMVLAPIPRFSGSVRAAHRKNQAKNCPSPNCVYVG